MKKKIIILIPIAVILLGILGCAAFYSIPFSKANSLLIAANKSSVLDEIGNNSYLAQKDYEKLRVVPGQPGEDDYVQLKTRKKYSFRDFKTVDLICSVKATVFSSEEMTVENEYTGEMTISFSFENFKWIVTNVERNEIG